MLYYLIVTLYVIVCALLIITILLQQGKGGDIANAFGGGSSQAVFGARSGATLLTRATSVLAGLFVIGALALVARVSSVAPDRAPNTAWLLPPPNAFAISPPLPCCNRMVTISSRQTST